MKESPRIIALMYHRIDEADTDPWGICVSPEHFDEQLQVIKQRLPVITTEEAIRQATTGRIRQTSACITFDDGYADNYTNALPILQKHHLPATFFIATAFTGSSVPFWWDELEMICLHTKQLTGNLSLSVNHTLYTFPFETSITQAQWQQHRNWKWYEQPPTARCDSFLKLWNLLRPLLYSGIEESMVDIRSWVNANIQSRLPMNENQLQGLSLEKLATIGLHTHTHLDLASQSGEVQHADILAGKAILQNQYRVNPSVLAYPYGNFTETTLSVAERLRLQGCFTTQQIPITKHSDIRKLGRYQAGNWNAQQFTEQLLNWMQD